jgi:hypothetical protein
MALCAASSPEVVGETCWTVGATPLPLPGTLAMRALSIGPWQELLPALSHIHHLQTVQVLDHTGPLALVTLLLQSGLQLLTEHKRQERAEHMASDRLGTPVEDWASF